MPTSENRLAANRANATHSTGPKTPEGKTRASRNSRKHGFTASSFVVVRLEELDAVARLKADLVDCYQPVNSQELFAIERIAIAQQALLRITRLETGLFTDCLNTAMDNSGRLWTALDDNIIADINITRQQNRNYGIAHGFLQMARVSNGFLLFLRYQAQTERNYRRAIEEFERLKALRKELPNEPIMEPDVEETTQDPVNQTKPIRSQPDLTPSAGGQASASGPISIGPRPIPELKKPG